MKMTTWNRPATPDRACTRRRLLLMAGALASVSFAAPWVSAQSAAPYPNRTLRIVVPYPAGSAPDQAARALAQSFQGSLGQSVVVENKAGALGVIGTLDVARSPPDGYTLLMTTNTTQAANVALVKNLQYDPVKDFSPVGRVGIGPMVLLVRGDSPASSVAEMIRMAQTSGQPISVGYGSAASLVAAAKVSAASKLDVVNVPYKGIPAAVTDLLGGHVLFTFADLAVAMPMVRSGRAKALGVTSLARLGQEPQIPALAETFPGLEVIGWIGLVAPAGTPDAVIDRLNAALTRALNDPEVIERFKTFNLPLAHQNPKQFGDFIVKEIAKWKADAQQAGLKPE